MVENMKFKDSPIKRLSILGSTGSVGRNTLEVIRHHRHQFEVIGLAAGRNVNVLIEQALEFRPQYVSLNSASEADIFRSQNPDPQIQVLVGSSGAEQIASLPENDIVVSAITGIDGLKPTLKAIEMGKRVALANKESMVVAGPFLQQLARQSGAEIIPVDSEHSGIYQCLRKERPEDIKKVVLTASGGPFFRYSPEQMKAVTLEDTLHHPRWEMGRKITVDSATMMNKGLELIEARWLFNLAPEQLDVVVHPQSIIHSLVELRDGSLLAQLSPTDMKIPIQYALTAPYRENSFLPPLDLKKIIKFEFYEVDIEKFPLFKLAREALTQDLSFSVFLNGANEEAVAAFLRQEINFYDLVTIVLKIIDQHQPQKVNSLESIFEIDHLARQLTKKFISQWMRGKEK